MLDDPAVLALIYVVFAAYIYSNIIALGARVIPELFADPDFRTIFRKQPIGLPLLLLLVFACVVTPIETM